MAVKLNETALRYARSLIKDGKDTHDERDAWSEHAPSTAQQNDYIKKHGIEAYAKWHLGIDESKSEGTKGRYSFPFGDFVRVHRCAIISLESRAAQNDHNDIAKATKQLLESIDTQKK
ncbi:MAG TPA: hypothetical protein VGC18_07590 [Lacisediminihabitans sp.]|uniref:hypothetical protein n=1 Tax=Lacisediminihabitans sp. TaxID=2787631 RepID=UPI002ED85808